MALSTKTKIYTRLSCLYYKKHIFFLVKSWSDDLKYYNGNGWWHWKPSTVTATTSRASTLADCDSTVCYTLVLSCGGGGVATNKTKKNHETLSLVCLFRDPSTPPRPKSLFDLWNVIRFVPRNNQGLNIYNDCVLNKTIKLLFFLFKLSLRFFFNSFQSDHTCMLYIELFIIKDCTLIFQSTYYMYKWRADRDRSRFLLVKLSRNTSFFYYWKY